jgi:uncharacterized damage-inducible protein DinB
MNEERAPEPGPLPSRPAQRGQPEAAGADQISEAFIARARSFLGEDYLPKIARCLEQLTDEEVWWRAAAESNSIGNLILHLTGNARQWIVSGVGGGADHRMRQREFDRREVIPRAELLALLEETIEEVDAALRRVDPTSVLARRQIQGQDVTVLEAIFHVVEHFSMHTGQIILLTKILTKKDLGFYDFSNGAPVATWHSK